MFDEARSEGALPDSFGSLATLLALPRDRVCVPVCPRYGQMYPKSGKRADHC